MNQINSYTRFTDKQINSEPHTTPEITECERKIIKYIGEGASNTEIGIELDLNKKKINEIIKTLLSKTNTRNLAHLMMFAAINNILAY